MSNRNIFYYLITFVLYVAFQVIFLKNLSLFGFALCFAYVGYLLTLPVEMPPIPLLLLGFGMGLVVDIFYDTIGMHAASCTLLAYLRKPVLQLVRPSGGYEAGQRPNVAEGGLNWFASYCLLMVLVHHLLLFLISASNFNIIWWTLSRALASTAFTAVVIILVQQFKKLYFYSRRR